MQYFKRDEIFEPIFNGPNVEARSRDIWPLKSLNVNWQSGTGDCHLRGHRYLFVVVYKCKFVDR